MPLNHVIRCRRDELGYRTVDERLRRDWNATCGVADEVPQQAGQRYQDRHGQWVDPPNIRPTLMGRIL